MNQSESIVKDLAELIVNIAHHSKRCLRVVAKAVRRAFQKVTARWIQNSGANTPLKAEKQAKEAKPKELAKPSRRRRSFKKDRLYFEDTNGKQIKDHYIDTKDV